MNNPETMALVLNEVVYLGLFFSCFSRLCRTNVEVCPNVRFGFVVVAVGSIATACSPYLWHVKPTWPQVLIGACFLMLQWATTHKWDKGVPSHFLREKQCCLKPGGE